MLNKHRLMAVAVALAFSAWLRARLADSKAGKAYARTSSGE